MATSSKVEAFYQDRKGEIRNAFFFLPFLSLHRGLPQIFQKNQPESPKISYPPVLHTNRGMKSVLITHWLVTIRVRVREETHLWGVGGEWAGPGCLGQ